LGLYLGKKGGGRIYKRGTFWDIYNVLDFMSSYVAFCNRLSCETTPFHSISICGFSFFRFPPSLSLRDIFRRFLLTILPYLWPCPSLFFSRIFLKRFIHFFLPRFLPFFHFPHFITISFAIFSSISFAVISSFPSLCSWYYLLFLFLFMVVVIFLFTYLSPYFSIISCTIYVFMFSLFPLPSFSSPFTPIPLPSLFMPRISFAISLSTFCTILHIVYHVHDHFFSPIFFIRRLFLHILHCIYDNLFLLLPSYHLRFV